MGMVMTAPLLAVVGLKREAALVGGPSVVSVAGGGDAAALRARLETQARTQAFRALISVGLGGALSPALDVGEWVIADRIVANCQTHPTDTRLTHELQRALPGSMTGPIAASNVIVADASAKAALHAATGALAVDMESGVAAEFAAANGLPFAALRVISDAADRALPRAAQAGMSKDGGLDILAVLWELAKDPRQLPALIRTGREAEAAFRRLKLLGRDNFLGRLGVGDPDLGQLPLDVV